MDSVQLKETDRQWHSNRKENEEITDELDSNWIIEDVQGYYFKHLEMAIEGYPAIIEFFLKASLLQLNLDKVKILCLNARSLITFFTSVLMGFAAVFLLIRSKEYIRIMELEGQTNVLLFIMLFLPAFLQMISVIDGHFVLRKVIDNDILLKDLKSVYKSEEHRCFLRLHISRIAYLILFLFMICDIFLVNIFYFYAEMELLNIGWVLVIYFWMEANIASFFSLFEISSIIMKEKIAHFTELIDEKKFNSVESIALYNNILFSKTFNPLNKTWSRFLGYTFINLVVLTVTDITLMYTGFLLDLNRGENSNMKRILFYMAAGYFVLVTLISSAFLLMRCSSIHMLWEETKLKIFINNSFLKCEDRAALLNELNSRALCLRLFGYHISYSISLKAVISCLVAFLPVLLSAMKKTT